MAVVTGTPVWALGPRTLEMDFGKGRGFFWSHSKRSNSRISRPTKEATVERDVFIILCQYGSQQGAEVAEASSVSSPPFGLVHLLGTVPAGEAGASLMKSSDPWDRLSVSPSF